MQSGIYQIQSILFPDRIYIGSAQNLKQREKTHLRKLNQKQHINKRLQAHCNKYGIHDLEFIVLENCYSHHLIIREQFYINSLKPSFNICRIAGNTIGRPQSIETRLKRSKALTGRPISEQQKQSMKAGALSRYTPPQILPNGFTLLTIGEPVYRRHRKHTYACACCHKPITRTFAQMKRLTNCGCN